MEIRELGVSDDRGAVSRIYEESWKAAYKGIHALTIPWTVS
jgi:hypothetical protein